MSCSAGGTHHAFADRGEGFCVFNDIAVSARMAMTEEGIEKVLVIDLDVHQVRLNTLFFSACTFLMGGESTCKDKACGLMAVCAVAGEWNICNFCAG